MKTLLQKEEINESASFLNQRGKKIRIKIPFPLLGIEFVVCKIIVYAF